MAKGKRKKRKTKRVGKKKKPKVERVFLTLDGKKKVRCRMCGKPIVVGERRRLRKEVVRYFPNPHQPIEILSKEIEMKGAVKGVRYQRRFLHSECSAYSFGDKRRGLL